MHIVIDTKKLDFTSFENAQDVMKAFSAVNNAKIAELPKNHGDLIEREEAYRAVDLRIEELSKDIEFRRKRGNIDVNGVRKYIEKIPSVLKANKGGD